MPGIHHPTAPPDPAMLDPHPRETCERDRCGKEAAARRRCPRCGKWYMGTAQRDRHVTKEHTR